MSARETLSRWIEAMQILCGKDDNPGPQRRAGYEETRHKMLDAYRAEVIAEADLLPKADVVAWLTKKAREFRSLGHEQGRAQGDAVAAMASKVDRGAIRPDNLRMGPADFFEPDRTYTAARYPSLRYVCEHVTRDPKTGEREAWGWLHRSDGTRRMERMWDADYPHWNADGGDGDV